MLSLPRMLHIANSYPDAIDRELFYAMKAKLLRRYAAEGAVDVQEIPGKECYSCDGCGVYWHNQYEYDTCYRCNGSGWYRSPRWSLLQAYTWRSYRFHSPIGFRNEAPGLTQYNGNKITGFVTHKDYGYRRPFWCALALGLLFDRHLLFAGLRQLAQYSPLVRAATRRCSKCQRHVWSRKRWYCKNCA